MHKTRGIVHLWLKGTQTLGARISRAVYHDVRLHVPARRPAAAMGAAVGAAESAAMGAAVGGAAVGGAVQKRLRDVEAGESSSQTRASLVRVHCGQAHNRRAGVRSHSSDCSPVLASRC